MDSMSVGLNEFSRVVWISVFNSCYVQSFCEALTCVFIAFLSVFDYFSLPIGILFCLTFFFDFYLTLCFLDD
jgi:hypothetical protein